MERNVGYRCAHKTIKISSVCLRFFCYKNCFLCKGFKKKKHLTVCLKDKQKKNRALQGYALFLEKQ